MGKRVDSVQQAGAVGEVGEEYMICVARFVVNVVQYRYLFSKQLPAHYHYGSA